MISIELLRRYPFFGRLGYEQLKALAMIAEEIKLEDGQVVIEEGKPADALYFLVEGSVVLYHPVGGPQTKGIISEVPVCEINPGEPFSISALIEPHILTSTGRSSGVSRVIRLTVEDLKAAFAMDARLECMMIRCVAEAAMGRLNSTRVQLAAAYA
ncbi:MAG: Crp/Fnr family transcriptional regulator [Anaerolineales bacterium]|jgi:CRP-like cAMP-binding protein